MRRRRSYPIRRGRFFAVAPAAAAAPPSTPPPGWLDGRRPLRGVPRRGRFLPVPLVGAAAPAAPAFVAGLIRQAGRRPAWTRRGDLFAVPADAGAVPPLLRRHRRPVRADRRAKLFPIPPAPQPAGASQDLPPALVGRQAPRRFPTARRRALFTVPLVGAAVVPTNPPPNLITARRRPSVPTRRGSFARVVAVVTAPAPAITRRRPAPAKLRRGRFTSPPWPQIPPPVPPAFPPPMLRAARRPRRVWWRGRFFDATATVPVVEPVAVRTVQDFGPRLPGLRPRDTTRGTFRTRRR